MGSLATAFVAVRPDLTGFGPALNKGLTHQPTPKGAAVVGEKAGDAASKGFGTGFKRVAGIATGVLGGLAIADKVKETLVASIDVAREAEKTARVTTQVIKNTGGVAHVSAVEVKAMADALAAKSGVDSAIIANSENVLLSFKQVQDGVGAGNDIFSRATQDILDLSVAMGMSLPTATRIVGKALNDPVKGMGMLSKAGISFTKEQTDTIKKLAGGSEAIAKAHTVVGAATTKLQTAQRKLNDLHTIYVEKTHLSVAQTVALRNAQFRLGDAQQRLYDAKTPKAHAAAVDAVSKAQRYLNGLQEKDAAGTKLTAAERIRLRDANAKVATATDVLKGANKGLASALGGSKTSVQGRLEAQKIILKELEGRYKGTADAAAEPAAKARVAMAALQEAIGKKLLPLLDRLSNWFVKDGAPMIQDWAGKLVGLAGVIGDHMGVVKALVGIYAAWRLAAIAYNVVQLVSLGLLKAHTVGTAEYTVVSGIARAATALWAGVTWLLNAAWEANPIGVVILLIAALAGGIIYAYKHSEKFRAIVDATWKLVSAGAKFMWEKVLKPTFKFLVSAWVTVAGAIIDGAAAAFGWVPGLGPKLKDAAKAFHKFGDNVNDAMNRIDDKSITVSAQFRATYGQQAGGAKLTSSNFAQTHGRKQGGLIPALPGSVPHQDSVQALLVPGEFVVREDGSNLHDAVSHFARFALGGLVVRSKVPSAKSISGSVEGAFGGMLDKLAGPLANAMMRDLAAMGGGSGGAGVGRWAPLVAQVLSMLGQSLTWLPLVLRRMNQESGGNPSAINRTDINALMGIPSQGLMQVIPPTFAAYAGPFAGRGLLDPLANIYAGLNYALHRYGSLGALGRPGGYDTGGIMGPGQSGTNYGRRPERVLSARQTESFDRLVALLEGGGGPGRGMDPAALAQAIVAALLASPMALVVNGRQAGVLVSAGNHANGK